MYCHKCGRKLKPSMRFCDYCGSPVGTNDRRGGYGDNSRGSYQQRRNNYYEPPKRESAETIKRRAQMERDRKKREQERIRTRKNRRNAILAIFLALITAVLLAWVSNGWMSNELEKEENVLETTEKASSKTEDDAAEETDEVESEDAGGDSEADDSQTSQTKKYVQIAKKCDKYTDDRMDDISGVYPKSFEVAEKPNSNALEAFSDSDGDGFLSYCTKQVGTSAKADKLLTEYTNGLGADILDEDSDSNWYMVTYERNDKVNHRMAVLVDGLCVYYDFSYPSDSELADSYDEYIEYMDYYLRKEINSLSEKNKSDE